MASDSAAPQRSMATTWMVDMAGVATDMATALFPP